MTKPLSFLKYLKFHNIRDRLIYLKWYSFLEKSQWWSKEENDLYQWQKVKILLNYSYNNIPYYNELLSKMGATPEDFKTWADFRKIPYLKKEIVRERQTDFVPGNIKNLKKLKYCTTSGSTGMPLEFFRFNQDDVIENAFMNNQWSRVGYEENCSRVILRGGTLPNNKLFLRQRFSNNWLLSSYYLSEKYIKQYIDLLNQVNPDFFHVYPSSLYIFTQLLLDSKLTLNFYPKAILCGSEPVFDYQRSLFESTYKTRVYSWLGLAEGTILAGECEYSSSYHIWPQYSYVELIDDNNLLINEKGTTASIVGTSFNNLCTPFIRYKCDDRAMYGADQCNLCGRKHLILEKIESRKHYILILNDGTEFPLTALHYNIDRFDSMKHIKDIQLVQKTKGKLIIRINALSSYSLADESEIRKKICSSLNERLIVNFEYTDDFIKTKGGKNIFFLQNIKRELDLDKY